MGEIARIKQALKKEKRKAYLGIKLTIEDANIMGLLLEAQERGEMLTLAEIARRAANLKPALEYGNRMALWRVLKDLTDSGLVHQTGEYATVFYIEPDAAKEIIEYFKAASALAERLKLVRYSKGGTSHQARNELSAQATRLLTRPHA